ncbi:0a3ad54a-afdd-47ff-92a6-37352155be89 [Sclerotinia trifoliorum]|uniref:0a3ad54a-afdd-47ff-92a6-37352155be89 n=1 Tax=Sclerotinia trifoliorum TaxID=28548 RepID=A0A8H2ZN24_9HELO|nr:0a3ad54a-afdd-47ff-92a6-37352155be89 [Sclerotinia trifoliorum]
MSFSASSSDSDNSRRRRRPGPPPPPPPFQGNKNNSKKKKKYVAPQDTIDKLWSRFSVSKFSKATKVLPNPAPFSRGTSAKTVIVPPPGPQNQLVSEDFERAVQECRAKVRKLVKECRRVNMRYRDPSFDIDWDLKWEKGNCLNTLAETRFEVCKHALSNPSSSGPRAVKRVHEIFDKPTFLEDKISPSDVRQGNLGDCWLMASLTALANTKDGIRRICVEWDTKIGIYGFVFHRDGEWIISIIDDKLYLKSPDWDSPSVHRHLLEQTDREDVEKEYRKTYQTGSQSLFFAHCKDPNQTWLPLLEKAYAKAHGDYHSLSGGWIGEGVEDITGGVTTELLTSDILDTDEFWHNEILNVNKEFLFGCSTGLLDYGYGSRDGISEGHAYVIMEARELSTGERLLKLRNPWGKIKKGNWEGPWSDGSKEFTPEAQIELNHKFGNDSVFWISYQDLLRKYQHFDRTRLFMDSPDWRLTQEWISVEVPWRSEFEQKFMIVLKKESPIVLVMSQLDDRYFIGLRGQYTFRLQFRLHDINSPDEEDYIVRSHGNYLMNRSVVTELKSLPAGTYTVFMMVIAERDKSRPSVEDVVREELRRREDNEKLAQVGTAYDLAHRKGLAHMEAKSKLKRARDKAKAKESRITQRKVLWEKRHNTREIVRKQEKKNREKRESKEVKDAEEVKKKSEREPKDQAVQTEDIPEVQVEKHDKSIQTEDHLEESTKNVMDTEITNERDKAVQTEDLTPSSNESQATPITPKSNGSSPQSPYTMNPGQGSHHHGSPPPPPGPNSHRRNSNNPPNHNRGPPPPPPPRPGPYITSEGESSASPISDYDMYSDDDPTLKPRNPPNEPKISKEKDDDEDDEAEPWNAVCIVGFRVYSKDEGLVLKVCEEGVEGVGDVDEKAKDTSVNDLVSAVTAKVDPDPGEDLKVVSSSDSSETITGIS